MRRKTNKKCQASVQQTFCVKESFKKFIKDSGKFILGLVFSEIFSAVFHSEAVASILGKVRTSS